MYTTTETARPGGFRAFLRRTEDAIDRRGKWAWIALLVLAFIFVWPVGLALLAYLIWGKQMFARSCGHSRKHDHHWGRHVYRASLGTGNTAFDTYKSEALRRLEEEQDAFEAFLQRLRSSKDKRQFDTFMEERARATTADDATEAVDTSAKPESGPRAGEY